MDISEVWYIMVVTGTSRQVCDEQHKVKTKYFREHYGLINSYRVKEQIKQAITTHNLDLSGLVVLTEAASRNYVVTPIIAAMANAKVYAITRDSVYGTAKDIEKFTYEFAEFCNVRDNITVIFEKNPEIIYKANIITNLGFVRPIDKEMIDMMNEYAVIPYMYEAWEYREGDIDLKACEAKGIPVMATNEDAIGLEVFDFVGPLCIKMLFELEIEIYKCKIAIFSHDKFGTVIKRYLETMGAEAFVINDFKSSKVKYLLRGCDALVVADLKNENIIIGHDGLISAKDLVTISPQISVVQYAGDVDISDLDRYGIPYVPSKRVGKYRMGQTLAYLGPKPVIDLHTAGLKVGEVMARARLAGKDYEETKKIAVQNSPAQDLK